MWRRNSTTNIGGFLADETPVEKILDKIVSAPIAEDSERKVSITEQVVHTESVTPGHDEQLLTELTGPTEASESQPVFNEEKVRKEPVKPQQEQIKKDILDRLTGPSSPKKTEDNQTEKS